MFDGEDVILEILGSASEWEKELSLELYRVCFTPPRAVQGLGSETAEEFVLSDSPITLWKTGIVSDADVIAVSFKRIGKQCSYSYVRISLSSLV
ncbi:hypothetical protein PanWU01x14_365590 [Parasponia andersonii]|uniref:Uncharacterized protein n=1 Tax=Parasponia andersonii TaxID=3476 RepID=A0A2P5A5Z0_PARAD|nr:hypothetical protein PanWU01x14_365590 [Parasponia andersonii]